MFRTLFFILLLVVIVIAPFWGIAFFKNILLKGYCGMAIAEYLWLAYLYYAS
jgi:hypothetical protein